MTWPMSRTTTVTKSKLLLLALGYAALLAYGTLYPFADWSAPDYNITERMDEEFYTSHIGDGKYDVIKTGESMLNGTRKGWDELRAFVESNDFTDDAMMHT